MLPTHILFTIQYLLKIKLISTIYLTKKKNRFSLFFFLVFLIIIYKKKGASQVGIALLYNRDWRIGHIIDVLNLNAMTGIIIYEKRF
jgi:hypothetical protein